VERLVGAAGIALVPLVERVLPGAWAEAEIQAEAHREDARVLALYQNDELLGFALFRVVLDEAELLLFGVDPARRREGLGRALFEGALEVLRGEQRSVVHLEVRAANASARSFYRALGFLELGLRRQYYRDPPDDAVRMSLAVKDRW
jgi:ribosomal-protein-alanine acetyltransferase